MLANTGRSERGGEPRDLASSNGLYRPLPKAHESKSAVLVWPDQLMLLTLHAILMQKLLLPNEELTPQINTKATSSSGQRW